MSAAAIYILDSEGRAQQTLDVQVWGEFMASDARGLQRTSVNGVVVVTAFVGMSPSPSPLLWETIVQGGEHDGATDRYTSRELAEAGHWRIVNFVRGAAA